MNSKVLLLLVGALCITGCARAYQITLEDAKEAINHGWTLYTLPPTTFTTGASYRITLSDGRHVRVACEYRGKYKTRFDCDIPRGNILPVKHYKALNKWFTEKHSSYYVKAPRYKYDSRFVNTGKKEKNEREKDFNFHIEVSDGRYNLLKKLLLRSIQ